MPKAKKEEIKSSKSNILTEKNIRSEIAVVNMDLKFCLDFIAKFERCSSSANNFKIADKNDYDIFKIIKDGNKEHFFPYSAVDFFNLMRARSQAVEQVNHMKAECENFLQKNKDEGGKIASDLNYFNQINSSSFSPFTVKKDLEALGDHNDNNGEV